jgi:hypothetical protein
MPLDWILSPVTLGALVASGLSLALYLFCTLKIEMRAAERRARTEPRAHPEVGELRRRVEAVEAVEARRGESAAGCPAGEERDRLAEPAPAGALRPAMNLNRRSQALRLSRRGENPEQIASSLALPAGEVRLLLKVHHILMEQAMRGPDRAARLKPGADSADMPSGAPKALRRDGRSIEPA